METYGNEQAKVEEAAEEEEAVDLGWLEPEPTKGKKKGSSAPAPVAEKVDEEQEEEDARVRPQLLNGAVS